VNSHVTPPGVETNILRVLMFGERKETMTAGHATLESCFQFLLSATVSPSRLIIVALFVVLSLLASCSVTDV
jgi:hypothetical protein